MDELNFNLALKYIFSVEGGYSNHKLDNGGKTNFGITQRTYDLYRKKNGLELKNVINITKDEAEKIYYTDFWCLSGANKAPDNIIAIILFDTAVNHGVGAAKQMYKKAGNNPKYFLDLRREKYKNIVKNNPKQKVFYKGWLNRLSRLENFIEKNYSKM